MSGEFNLDKRKTFVFGRLATMLYLISLLGLGFIGFSYSLFPDYVTPILLITVFGLAGLLFGFISGGMKISTGPITPLILVTGVLGLFIVFAIQIFTNVFSDLILQSGFEDSILAQAPVWVIVLFFGFAGIQEEAFWSGIYIYLRTVFRASVPLLIFVVAVGGMAYHQAVGRQLFASTIFGAPNFFLWIGMSWVLYRLLLELTSNVGVSMMTHFTWNVGVTLLQQGAFS